MRYLHSALICSPDPIISQKSLQYFSYSVLLLVCGWFIGVFLFDCLACPDYRHGGASIDEFVSWFNGIYLTLYLASGWLWLSLISVSTAVSVYAIIKQF